MDDITLLSLASQADVQAQQRAAEYFEQLKQLEQGWQLCMNALATNTYNGNDHARFFCFQVIEHYLKTRYTVACEADQQSIRSFLMTWIHNLSSTTHEEKTFILNKAAQMFLYACLCDYPRRWPTFFDDLLKLLTIGTSAVDMYLRILLAIDSEVVDKDIAHTENELQRNSLIKDSMRQQCIVKLVNSWYDILVTYDVTNPAVACMCLEVIGAYVSWVDISLIANDRFVNVLLLFMSKLLLRESACDCIHEIISKGMDPVSKTKLIESFTSVLSTAGLLSINEEEDGDYLAKLAKLVNGMGQQLIISWQKLVKSKDESNSALTLAALESKIPFMLKFLSNDDDDVSATISPFAHDYVTLLKQMTPINNNHKQTVKEMLYVIIKKKKVPTATLR